MSGRRVMVVLMAAALMAPSAALGAPSEPRLAQAAPATAGAHPAGGSAPRCVDGHLTTRDIEGAPVMLGLCGGGGDGVGTDADAAAGDAVGSAVAPGPLDCAVPILDDRCETWVSERYDGPRNGNDAPGTGAERRTTMIAHPTADLLFVGGTSNSGSGATLDVDFVEIAYRASTGQRVWTRAWGGAGDLTLAYQSSIALSPDGATLYALGIVGEPGIYKYQPAIVAFETSTGALLWERTYDGGIQAIQTGTTTLADGTRTDRIYAAGSRGITALDAGDGRVLWVAPVGVPGGQRLNQVAVSPDGSRVFAAGGEHRPDGFAKNFLTVAVRAADGATLWTARDSLTQPDAQTGNNGVTDLKVTPDGSRVVITGFDPVIGGIVAGDSSAILTIAHDAATGDVAWRASYGGPVEGETHYYFSMFQGMLAISPDGHTAVVAAAISSGSASGTAAYDVLTGKQLWGVESRDPVGYAPISTIGFYPQVTATDDRAFVSNRRDYGLAQTATVTTAYGLDTGVVAWAGRFGTTSAFPCGIARSPDGKRVFVGVTDKEYSVALSAGVGSLDIVTMAYDT